MIWLVVLSLFFCSLAMAEEAADRPARPVMLAPSDEMQDPSDSDAEKIESVFSDISEACRAKDMSKFLSHFTPKRAKFVAPRVKNAMDNSVSMKISTLDVLGASEDEASVQVKYFWEFPDEESANLVTSKFTMKNTNGVWRIDAEDPVDSRMIPKENAQRMNAAVQDLGSLDWDKLPAIPPDARTYEGGCANGRCGVAQ